MAMYTCNASASDGDEDSGKDRESMRQMFGPHGVDQAVGQAITTCWMMLPDDKRTIANVEAEIRRIVDRALANLKEDAKAFGIDTSD